MSSAVSNSPEVKSPKPAAKSPSARAEALAVRLEQGAAALEAFAATLTEGEWQMHVRPGGRKLGVMVHHVAWIYPLEVQLAMTVAAGNAVTGLVWDNIHELAAQHMEENNAVTKAAAFALLRQNSAAAAATIRTLTDEDLDRAAPVSLYEDAPLTCQFLLEDHAVRHSYHHLAKIRGAVKR